MAHSNGKHSPVRHLVQLEYRMGIQAAGHRRGLAPALSRVIRQNAVQPIGSSVEQRGMIHRTARRRVPQNSRLGDVLGDVRARLRFTLSVGLLYLTRPGNVPMRAFKALICPALGPRGWRTVFRLHTMPMAWHVPQ